MRQAILEIPEDALDMMFVKQPQGGELHLEIVNALPEDAKMLACRYVFDRRIFQLVYESDEFEDISKSERLPVLPAIEFKQIDYSIPSYVP